MDRDEAESAYLGRPLLIQEEKHVASMKLTKRAVEKLVAPHPTGKQTLVWDTDLKGFGVLLSGKTTAKTYIVQHRLRSGRTRRVTIGPVGVLDLDDHDGEEGAKTRARKVLGEFYSGVDPKAERRVAARRAVSLRSTLDAYIAANRNLRPKSIAGYRGAVLRHLAPWLDLPLREVTAEMVEDRHAAIAAGVKRRNLGNSGGGPATGAASANGTMRAFRALWNFAAERDPDLPANPVRRLKRAWYPVPRRERLVRADQLPPFYKAVDELPNRTARDFILLLVFTGLRRGEAAALRWEEVDFAQRVIRLPARRTKAGRKLDLPMSSFVRHLLVARRALGNDGGWVFGADSGSGHIEEPRFALAQIAEATGIRVSCHDLRRTYITVAESSDISPLALKALVNHALGGDVTSGYVQMTIERLREPAQRVCDRMMELCGIDAPAGSNVAQLALS
jgi:integrase